MEATDFLERGIETMAQRAAERDVAQERSMKGTVDAFNSIYGTNLSEAQGWAFMVLLKLKRSSVGPFRPDDYIDGVSYFGLYGEARANE